MKKITPLILFALFISWQGYSQTGCSSITAPYTENFDSGSIPNCWSQNSANDWEFDGTISWNTAGCSSSPSDHTTGTGEFAAVDMSNATNGTSVILEMPSIDVSSLTIPTLRFYMFFCSTGYTPVNEMYVEAYDGSVWNQIALINTGSATWEEFNYDLSTFKNGNSVEIRFRVEENTGTYSYYGDIAIDDVSVIEQPTCIKPGNVQNTAVTTNTADFSWDTATTATTGYNWVVMAIGDDPLTATPLTSGSVATGTTTVQVTGLSSSSNLSFYVQSDCGNGDLSDWSNVVNFTTNCAAYTITVCENFDTTSVGSSTNSTLPNCWSFIDSGTGYGYTRASSSYSGANAFYMYNSSDSSGDYILISPEITNVMDGTNRVNFWVDGNSGQDLIVGTMSDPTDATTFTAIQTISLVTSSYENYKINIPTGTDSYVGFKHGQTGTFDSYYFDDICIEPIPSCVIPVNVQNTSVANVNADFSWDAETTATTGYNWVVMADGDDPAVDTPLANGAVATGVTTAQATGLTAQTDYDFYVQSDCGVTNGLSNWSVKVDFTTACSPVTSPFCENFDTTSTGTSSNPSSPDCWSFIDSGAGYGYTRAYTANSGSNSFYMYNGSDSSGDYILVSPPISNISDGTNRLNFWVDGSAGQDLIIGTMSNPIDASTFTAIQTVTLVTSAYEEYTINIPAGTDSYIGFKHGQTGSYDAYYFDDICFEAIPSCEKPTNLSVSYLTDITADLNWDAVSNATSGYNWAVMTVGDDPAVDSPVASGSVAAGVTTALASGLTAVTDYEFYVQADCGTTDGLSAWEGPLAFTTLCTAYIVTPTTPFEEDFVASSTPLCWSEIGDNSWEYSTSTPAYAASGLSDHTSGGSTLYAVMDGSDNGDGDVSTLITPLLDISALTSPTLTFYAFSNNTNDAAINVLDVEFYDGSTWNNVLNQTTLLGTNWVEFNFDLSNYTITGKVQVRFTVTGNSNGGSAFYNDIVIDDVSVYEFSCMPPSNITNTSVTTTTADFSWTASLDDTNGYEYLIMLDGDIPGVDTPVTTATLGTGATSVSVSGLSPGVNYDFYIRTICSLDGSWAMIDFTTAIPPCDLPTAITNTSVSLNTADFSWTASADEMNGYIWYIMTDGENPLVDTPLFNGTVGTGITTVQVTGLTPGTPYDFYIQTDCGGTSISLMSTKLDFTTDNYPCTPPSSVSNNALTDVTAKFTWQTNGLETGGYSWVLMADGDDPSLDMPLFNGSVSTGVTTVIISGLTPMTSYDFYVKTSCSTDDSDWSVKVDITTLGPPCDAPTAVTLVDVQTTTAEFSWTASPDETNGYQWYVMTDGDDPLVDMPLFSGNVSTGVTTVTVTGLASVTSYDFYIQTDCGSSNMSDWSSKLDVTTLASCDAPTAVTLVDVQTTLAEFSWSASPDETNGYEWYVMTDGDDPLVDMPLFSGSVATGVTSVIVTGLTQTTDYDFYVKTYCDANNESDWSIKVDFVTEDDLSVNNNLFNNFKYYPNPVSQMLTLNAGVEINEVSIYNLLGQQVLVVKPNSLTTNLDLSKLQTGPYIVKVVINESSKMFKIIKE